LALRVGPPFRAGISGRVCARRIYVFVAVSYPTCIRTTDTPTTVSRFQRGTTQCTLMKRSYDELAYHVVFATKHRQRLIPPELDDVVQRILYEACQMVDAHVYAIGTADDHAHLLLSFPVGTDVPKALGRIKGRASFYISRSCEQTKHFAWQCGYGIYTVSKSAIPMVERYVLSQRRKHGTEL